MKKTLFIAIIFQIFILCSLLLYAYLPIYFGSTIKVRASGYDPRDLLLGNYTALSYEIEEIKTQQQYKKNQIIYLTLKKHNGLHVTDTITQTKPKNGTFLKGRVRSSYKIEEKELYKTFLKFGINKYYTTKENAQKLEAILRDKNATVTLKVLGGMPRIESIIVDK